MKIKSLLLGVFAMSALGAVAAQPQQLALESGAFHPVLSPDGAMILYSTVDHQGLKAYDIATRQVTIIDEGVSAGFDPIFSSDGSRVYYRTATMTDGLLYRDVRSFDLTRGSGEVISQPSRRDINLRAISSPTYAYASYHTIAVGREGAVKQISPLADAHSYLWASLSPDNSILAFDEPFTGVYVATAEGENPRKVLDKGDFISWVGSTTLVAVVSHDDGYVILDSRLVSIDINSGEVTYLTPEDVLVGEASASVCGKVVYTDLSGNMFIMNLNQN